MKKKFKFYKDYDNRWYVDLPEWQGDKADLEMVGGADNLLDIIAQGDDEVHLLMSIDRFDDCMSLELVEVHQSPGSGATYLLRYYKGIPFDMNIWLCDVTKFVFGDFPKTIYFS